MKIYISSMTVGKYGEGLKGNLRFLPNVIQSALDNSNFVSMFSELWLTLAYPPMYALPGIVSMVDQYFDFYIKFPYSRLDRRYKKVEITLKAPEFSEHFDLKEQDKNIDMFEIESQYKSISEIDLAKTLIDKYLEAGEIINSKVKKGDNFDFDKFQAILISVKSKISADFLESINKEQTIKVNDEILDRAMKIREERKRANRVKDKKVRDVRIYYNGFPNKALYPYDFQYVEIFRNLLRRSDLLCPIYHHLHIQASKTFEDGLRNSLSIEDWYVNGVSVLDYDKYSKGSESEKEQIVIELISNGLLDIATIDNLDASIVKNITNKVKSTGLNTELIFDHVENDNHALTITYLSRSIEEQCPVFFKLLDKKTNRTNKVQIGRADNFQIYFWLQKVSLTRNKIKVKSSRSIEADVALRDKPRSMEFDIEEIMSTPHTTPM